jgi:hypothetical protein
VSDFRTFKILLDSPAAAPALGFDDYASAFADVIRHSAPQFAIGIFGDWGSGKTTLMRAIQEELLDDTSIVCVWFNAWRYEREEHLIVPLLDTLREALAEWPAERAGATKARSAAATIGRAARALAVGLKLHAAPVGVGLDFDPAKALESWTDQGRLADDPVSFYHASFNQMRGAIEDFALRGRRRIVVFVDDLDRCLPLNALEVLESMKLFFDLEGFVFVVGLDQTVIERAVELKYRAPTSANGGSGEALGDGAPRPQAQISGSDYVKKIFQVPFGLPRISTDDLLPFFDSLVLGSGLPAAQQNDLGSKVRPHVAFSAGGGSVNPREVKRLINAYTLQMKLLTAKVNPRTPDPEIVLALQTMAFRSDWRSLYERLTADPDQFVFALRQALETNVLSVGGEILPQSYVNYVRGRGRALVRELRPDEPGLAVYVTSAESTRSVDTALLEAQTMCAQLHSIIRRVGVPGSDLTEVAALAALRDTLGTLTELVQSKTRHYPSGKEAARVVKTLESTIGSVSTPSSDVLRTSPQWAREGDELLAGLAEILRQMRSEGGTGATSAA